MPAPNREYQAMMFDNTSEAAAFVAALSRFLNSPRASVDAALIEVWSFVSPPRATLYLNDAAKNAAAQAFAPLPPTRTCKGSEFAAPSRLILGHRPFPIWGADDAERALLKQ